MAGPVNNNNPVNPYDNMDAWLNEDSQAEADTSTGDTTFLSDAYVGANESEAPQNQAVLTGNDAVKQLTEQFKQVKASSLEVNEKNKQLKHIRDLMNQAKNYGNKPISAALDNEILALDAQAAAGVDGNDDGSASNTTLKTQIEDFKSKVQQNSNLSDAKKEEYSKKLDQWLNGLQLESADPDTIQSEFEALQQEISDASAYAPGIQGLAEASGIDPQELQKNAEQLGMLDQLKNPPNPPTADFIKNVIKICGKEEIFAAVKEKVVARMDFYNTERNAANSQNGSNSTCTSNNNDNMDFSHFQNLYDLKYHQDTKSKEVASAMNEATSELIPCLKAIYGNNVDVKQVEAAAGEGWKGADNAYNVAGQISVAGSKIDLFNNTTGEISGTNTPDTSADNKGDAGISLVTIMYDGEGDGAWFGTESDSSQQSKLNEVLQHYGEDKTLKENYDPDNG